MLAWVALSSSGDLPDPAIKPMSLASACVGRQQQTRSWGRGTYDWDLLTMITCWRKAVWSSWGVGLERKWWEYWVLPPSCWCFYNFCTARGVKLSGQSVTCISHVEMAVSGCLNQVAVKIFPMENMAWAARSPARQTRSRAKDEAAADGQGTHQVCGENHTLP